MNGNNQENKARLISEYRDQVNALEKEREHLLHAMAVLRGEIKMIDLKIRCFKREMRELRKDEKKCA